MAEVFRFPELNLPWYALKIKEEGGKVKIYDKVRKRYIIATNEEWVRQNFIHYLAGEKKYPLPLMAVEKKVLINNLPQRFDLLIYDRKGNPLLVAEFKSPSVRITQHAFSQAVRYNSKLKVPLVLVSNGIVHFICRINYLSNTSEYLKQIPEFEE